MEDAISVEEPVKNVVETCSSKFSNGDIFNPSLVSHPVSGVPADLPKLENAAQFNQIFLVLEVKIISLVDALYSERNMLSEFFDSAKSNFLDIW